MNLKKLLKTIKFHEEKINIFLGIIILIAISFFVIRYIQNIKNTDNVESTPVVTKQNEIHEVKKGETLWSIARQYYQKGENWKKIADINNIKDPKKIEIGQSLIIPIGDKITPTPSPTPQITAEAASVTSDIKEDSYIVVKGDNLWKIALRAYGSGYKWIDIAKANNLKNPNIIHPGNVFILPR